MDKSRLALEIECELTHLQKLAELAKNMLAVPENQRRPWDAMAAAKCIADLWLGFENLCKRRYRNMDLSEPQGPDSHSRILADFLAEPCLGVNLGADLTVRLKKYLMFRHRFVHGYGEEVAWTMVEEPLRLLPDTAKLLSTSWRKWLKTI